MTMYPRTPYGWYNVFVRGYPYNERTAPILDHMFKPSPRLLSTFGRSSPERRTADNNRSKATMAEVRVLLAASRNKDKHSISMAHRQAGGN
jgi:hypothetical protein